MAKKRHHKKVKPTPKPQIPWLWLTVGAAILLVLGGLSLMWTPSDTGVVTLDVTPEVSGSPRLAVDQEIIDEGYIKLNKTVQTTYRLRNVGDQPLYITGEPQVELVEGC